MNQPFDFFAEMQLITRAYLRVNGIESSPSADLREAPHTQVGDSTVGQPVERQDKARGGDQESRRDAGRE